MVVDLAQKGDNTHCEKKNRQICLEDNVIGYYEDMKKN